MVSYRSPQPQTLNYKPRTMLFLAPLAGVAPRSTASTGQRLHSLPSEAQLSQRPWRDSHPRYSALQADAFAARPHGQDGVGSWFVVHGSWLARWRCTQPLTTNQEPRTNLLRVACGTRTRSS